LRTDAISPRLFPQLSFGREGCCMQHDPLRLAETKDWLTKAKHDLRAAEVLVESDPPLFDVAVFHCQQAAEKAFKAFLFWNDVPFRKTHEIEQLGRSCQKIDASLENIVEHSIDLTPFAWRFRYPGDVMTPSLPDTKSALSLARGAYEAIIARLPEEARP